MFQPTFEISIRAYKSIGHLTAEIWKIEYIVDDFEIQPELHQFPKAEIWEQIEAQNKKKQ